MRYGLEASAPPTRTSAHTSYMLLPSATSAPFTTVAAVGANKDTAAFTSVLTGSLVGLWDRLINIKASGPNSNPDH